jgi:hypothetical protein
MKRRTFLQALAAASIGGLQGCATRSESAEPWVMTVSGRLPARDLGVTLTHEHAGRRRRGGCCLT